MIDRSAAYISYARGDDAKLAEALETVRANGEAAMAAQGNPCEPVPTDDPPAPELQELPDGFPDNPTQEELEELAELADYYSAHEEPSEWWRDC